MMSSGRKVASESGRGFDTPSVTAVVHEFIGLGTGKSAAKAKGEVGLLGGAGLAGIV